MNQSLTFLEVADLNTKNRRASNTGTTIYQEKKDENTLESFLKKSFYLLLLRKYLLLRSMIRIYCASTGCSSCALVPCNALRRLSFSLCIRFRCLVFVDYNYAVCFCLIIKLISGEPILSC